MKFRFFLTCLVLALAIYGCSTEITSTPVPASSGSVAWSALNLTGRLVYNAADNNTGTLSVQSLDLTTGDLHTIFELPKVSWSDAVAVSPDGKTSVMAYSALISAPYGGQQTLYSTLLAGSEPPALLIAPPTGNDRYYQPVWSPDGKYVYFTHVNEEAMATYEIMRLAYPNGSPQTLVQDAFWPRIADDGVRLVYVARDPQTGKNQLFLANADGSDAHQVPLSDLPVPDIIDTPMISPDNQSILFGSPDGPISFEPNWIDRMLDVQVAFANGSLPSDWWSVPIAGGTVTRLTQLQAMSLYGVYSPDRKYIVSYSLGGIFVMRPDGTQVTMVVNDVGGTAGTVSWIP